MKQGASHSIPHPSKLRVHEDSHLISKNIAPKIRIIHIFAPKIIKTDEANFRELVQSLTGQRARNKGTSTASTKNSTICQSKVSKAHLEPKKIWKESNQQILNPVRRKTVSVSNMIQVKNEIPIFQNEEKVKKEVVDQDAYKYKGQSSNHGFLMGGFSDMEGLFQDPSEFLPKCSKINIFGGMPRFLS